MRRLLKTMTGISVPAASRTVKQATKKTVKKKANKTASKIVKKVVRKVVKKTAKKAVGKTTKKIAKKSVSSASAQSKPPFSAGDWIKGHAIGAGGPRRYCLFRPHGVSADESLPLLVMLHGCSQNAPDFALSTRMNTIAARSRALVLYPEQDLRFNPQGCWNWYDTKSGQANAEAATLMSIINQVCIRYPVNREAVAIAGFSAGASMAALLATLHPARFRAVAMHSGVPPGSARSAASAVAAMRGLQRSTAPGGLHPWPPLLIAHGRRDRVVAISNAHAAAQLWASSLGARESTPRKVQRGKRYTSTVTDFRAGRRIVVSLNEIDKLGHSWSGGDSKQRFSDAAGPDTSRLIWSFFERQMRAAS
ncbi:hypothetical protein IMCC3135_11650 [Granulosicoccus antarcticus IMCC3135]|uniref:Uncharacterized protein n=2 Tax=Granulosicoccus TaxID=437504 RepID=A0A2Z2NUI2_9GAMM|nr:hypothetical protein IMCC3135_11650 [Granulosicoccus antarcticus IMCC3135]